MILQLLQRRRNRPTKPAPSLDQLIERCRYAEAAFAEAQGDYEIDAAIHDMAAAECRIRGAIKRAKEGTA